MRTVGEPKGRIRVALGSLGCKLNQAEAELLGRELAQAGYRLVSSFQEADIYILNTCTVTHVADRKSRHWLRLAHRRNPRARLVATGCYAQRAPEELARIEGVSLVLGNEEKSRLLELMSESLGISSPFSACDEARRQHDAGFRTRTLVKVQDGCRGSCAYCIVPLVRGSERSLPVEQVVAEVRQRVVEGYREVVLTGVKIGSYRCDGIGLGGLLQHILGETGVPRLRLSSLQPGEISPELIGLWPDERLCRHFHLSLQSGSDAVLRRMRRDYSVADYRRAVSLIRAQVPGAAITTDIIVGFPGETEAGFEESFDFCREMGFARIHVFPYSPRRGTEAARMPEAVNDGLKRQRSQRVLALAEESAQNFCRQFLGRTMAVLWEQQSGGVWSGLTDNYLKVYTRSSEDLSNKLLPAKLVEVYGDGVWGE